MIENANLTPEQAADLKRLTLKLIHALDATVNPQSDPQIEMLAAQTFLAHVAVARGVSFEALMVSLASNIPAQYQRWDELLNQDKKKGLLIV